MLGSARVNLEPRSSIIGLLAEGILQPGYIIDFISERPVRATPEETQATQIFSRRLVEDFGYPKENIVTRPQYRVRRSPSDSAKSYPSTSQYFLPSRKARLRTADGGRVQGANVRAGRKQLELYLTMSEAQSVSGSTGPPHRRRFASLSSQGLSSPAAKFHFSEIPTSTAVRPTTRRCRAYTYEKTLLSRSN